MAREAPPAYQFQRQRGLQGIPPEGTADAGSVNTSPLARQASVRETVSAPGGGEHNAPPSPYRASNSNVGAVAAAVAEEKDSGSVRSASKRHAVLTTPAQQAASPAVVSQPLGALSGLPSASADKLKPTGVSPASRSSPYAAPLSPNLSNLVKTGERRNGIPVTTVNLGYSSGIKRGPSFRDAALATSPKNK
jgi:hypothetical protein